MKITSTTALLLVAGALLAPKAHAQTTQPAPPGTTSNPSANTYNLDLVSLDQGYHTVSGSNPGATFYNSDGTHGSVSAIMSNFGITQNFLLKPHRVGGFVTGPSISSESVFVQRWIWEGPNTPADYQVVYEGTLGASIHFDGEGGNSSFSGQLIHDEWSHGDSIYQDSSGTATMSHVAVDAFWHTGSGTISATVQLQAQMSPGYVDGSGSSVAGPAVNDGHLDMLSNVYLFYPAAETEPQISTDW